MILAEEYQSIIYYYENQGGQRLILAEEYQSIIRAEKYQSIIYYFRLCKSGRAEAYFGGGMSIYNLLFQIMKIREGRG